MKYIKKIFFIVVAVFALFYLFTRPEDAAAAVRTAAAALGKAFNSIIVFFTSLAG